MQNPPVMQNSASEKLRQRGAAVMHKEDLGESDERAVNVR
jgi:hypothetical protein